MIPELAASAPGSLAAPDALVAPDDHWTIWAAIVTVAALSIVLEQRNRIARTLTGPVLALFGGMLLSNCRLLPTSSVSYDIVWTYLVPLVIALLLMRMDLRRVIRETGRLFVVFHFSSLGTIIGGIVGVLLLNRYIVDLPLIGAAMTASYIGGAVNFVAMVDVFRPSKHIVDATIVADNGVMALYFLFLIALPAIPLVRRIFPATERSRGFSEPGAEGGAEAFWKPKPISLASLASCVAVAFLLTFAAVKIAAFFSQPGFPDLVREVLGQKYLIITTLAVIFPLAFPSTAASLTGAEEVGTFFIYIFFVAVGIPASFSEVLVNAPLVLLFCAIMLAFNFFLTVGLGKLFGYELEEMILCAVVSSGGPMNGAAIAISKGWTRLVFPSVLAGIWGYVIGNYVGFVSGKLLIYWFGGN